MKSLLGLLAVFAVSVALFSLPARGSARHVVLVVFDGMRPDFVSEATAPTLTRLSREGVFFKNHHAVFLSSTEVNGVALATGLFPAHSGVVANFEYRPKIETHRAVGTEVLEIVRKGDAVSGGHYLAFPTFVEILQASGRTTLVAGSKPVALLFDRAERAKDATSINLAEGVSLPEDAARELAKIQGAFPAVAKADKMERDNWTVKAVTEQLWSKGLPDLSVVWLAEPDFSQHAAGPGSAAALRAIKNSDDNLAKLLKAIEERGEKEQTDVLVVSDHAFSTIERAIDLGTELSKAGWTTARAFTDTPPEDTVLVVGNGNVVCLYVIGRKANTIQKIAAWLQVQDFTGVVFTREPLPGTFTLAEGHIDSVEAPDLVVSLRWRESLNADGAAGLSISEGTARKPGQGNHTGLSRYDLHNTLIAAGPDFKRGIVDVLPTANTDLAPTILRLLGVSSPHPLDGRILSEALTLEAPAVHQVSFDRKEAKADLEAGHWSQYLLISEVNGVVYLDEGNGAVVPKPVPAP